MQVLTLPNGQNSITVFAKDQTAEVMLLAEPANAGLNVQRDDLVAAETGQTVFTLSLVPANPATALVWVNGVLQLNNVDYQLNVPIPGRLTWLNNLYIIQAGDIVSAYYGV